MKKFFLSVWPFLPLALLIVLLLCNSIVTKYTAEEEPQELFYRPAIMYQDELYFTTSSKSFRAISEESMECVGVLAKDVTIHQLPTENMQSCGCERLVGENIYICEEYPDYLFIYDAENTLCSFIRESAI